MFERIRAAVAVLTSPTPATPSVTVVDNSTTPAPTSTLDAAVAAAPAVIQGTRADLFEIKVNGLDAAKANAVWLTRGLDRSQPATAVKLVDCTSDHLKNIVANKPGLSRDYRRVIESILEDRGETLPDSADLHPDFTD